MFEHDLFVPGIGNVDIITPQSTTSDRNILNNIERKNDQATAILVQLDATPARMQSLAARTFGKPTARNINTLIFQLPNGQIVRFDRQRRP
jgi:filamentous hemagglutinin